jgi:hypothetical protein
MQEHAEVQRRELVEVLVGHSLRRVVALQGHHLALQDVSQLVGERRLPGTAGPTWKRKGVLGKLDCMSFSRRA